MKKIVILYLFSVFNFFGQSNNKEEVELLVNLIRIESFSENEEKVGKYLSEFCLNKGLHITKFIKKKASYNFAASLYPLELRKPNIILTSHLDVVSANNPKNWRFPPFEGVIENDTIWGRGVVDCKGLAVMQIYSILNLLKRSKNEDLPFNVTFLALSGEENNSPFGAKFIVEEHLKELNACVVFGEGGSGLTNLVPSKPELEVFGISIAEKSTLWLRVDAKNKTHGHGAVPPDFYANKRLLRALIDLLNQKKAIKFSKVSRQMFKDLGNMEGGLKGFVIKHINWTVFWPFVKKYFKEGEIFSVLVNNTFVITEMATINAGSTNQISNGAYAILDCRLLPGTDKKKFLRRVQFALGLKVSITVLSESPNTQASPKTKFYDNMQQALKSVYPKSIVSPILFPASTDNNYFRQYNIPTYGIIPAILSRSALEGIHGDNEFLPIKDFYGGIEVYKKLLEFSMQN